MNDTVITLENIAFAYSADHPILRQLNFELRQSERIGLLGANGSGKSTLLKLIVGLAKPTAGRISVFGRPRRSERDFQEVRRSVGLLFQDADDQLFCPTVAEDVAFGPMNLGKSRTEARDIVAKTLASLDMAGLEDRITWELSGGEKRLVALAGVLAMGPEVLLLDEPTTGLDPDATERLITVLGRLPQAMLIVSHDTYLLDRLSVRRLRLAAGQIL